MTADESQSRPVIVNGSVHSVASPLASRPSPVHTHSPLLRSVEEKNSGMSAQGSSQHHDESTMVDEPCIKVCAYQARPGQLLAFSLMCTCVFSA